MNSLPPVFHGVLESLEARLAPAGLVVLTTSGGVLTITGDGEANGLRITHVPESGEWRISDSLAGTTYRLNGMDMAAPFNIPEQNGIKADFKDGDDRFEFRPAATPSAMVLSGGINVKLGAGNDFVEIGFLSTSVMMVNGPVTVDGGLGDDTLNVWMTATFAQNVKLLGGAGNDDMVLNAGTAHQHYQKGLTVDFGTGTNSLTVNLAKFAVNGPLNIIGAGQSGFLQTIDLDADEVQLDGPVTVALKDGNVRLDLGNASTDLIRLGSSLKITTGTGSDVFRFDGKITVTGAVSIDAKGGINDLIFEDNGSFVANSLTYKGGTGGDDVIHETGHVLTLGGALSLSLGSALNRWNPEAGSSISAGSLNIQALEDDDTCVFAGSSISIAGSVSFNLGAGINSAGFTSTVSSFVGGSFTYAGGTGSDLVGFNGPLTRILGNVTLTMGNGSNAGVLGSGDLVIGGLMTYNGGADVDNLTFENLQLSIVRGINYKGGSGGGNSLYVRPVEGSLGAVSYVGGTGGDTMALGHLDGAGTARLDIFGAVNFKAAAGDSGFYVTDTVVHGKVIAATTSLATNSDGLVFNQSTFNGAVNLSSGAGSASNSFNDVIMRADFLHNMGNGNSQTLIETTAGTASVSRWYGKVTFVGGTGTDLIRVGATVPPDANAGNVFYRDVRVDGGLGAGVNTLTSGGNTFHAGSALIPTNFP